MAAYQRTHPHRRVARLWVILLLSGLLLPVLPASRTLAQDAGSTLVFDGQNDQVSLATTNELMGGTSWTQTKTLSLWVKPTGNPPSVAPEGGQLLAGNHGPRSFGISRAAFNGDDRIWVWNWESATNKIQRIGITYTPGEWVHIALVHGGGQLIAYKNGTQVGTVASGATVTTSTGGTQYFGWNGRANTDAFEGELDEVRFWNAALDQPTIAAWTMSELTPSHPQWGALAAYYKMSNGAGSVLTDDSGRGHPGTLLQGTTWGTPNAFALTPNYPPAADSQTGLTTAEDTPLPIVLTATDPEGDPLTYRIVSGPGQGGLDGVLPNITYTPAANTGGPDSFTFVANDGRQDSAEASVTIEVTPVNDPPAAQPDSATTTLDTAVDIDVLANDSDVEGDLLTIQAVGTPANGTATIESGATGFVIRYTPAAGFLGSDTFDYTISDGDQQTVSSVAIQVLDANATPDAKDDLATTDEDTPVTIHVLADNGNGPDVDADGDVLVITGVTEPAHGSATVSGDTILYTPVQDYSGADQFRYFVSDGSVSDEAWVLVTVAPVNDPPTLVADFAAVPGASPVTINVLANDYDVDSASLNLVGVGSATQGMTSISGNQVVYTPYAELTEDDSFTYTVSDGDQESTALVSVQAQTLATAGYALTFDGVDDYVKLNYTLDMLGPTWQGTKTVSLWVKPSANNRACLYQNPGHCDLIFGDRPAWWGINQGVVNGYDRIWIWNHDGNTDTIGVDYTAGEWMHIGMIHANGILSVTVNGVLAGSMPSSATLQPNTGAKPVLHLGGLLINAQRTYPFFGEIDEVELWRIERRVGDIAAQRFTPRLGDEAGLAAYYRMSDGAGTSLTDDAITSAWNGTLVNGPQWVTSAAFDGQAVAAATQAAEPTGETALPGTIILSLEGHPDDYLTPEDNTLFIPLIP